MAESREQPRRSYARRQLDTFLSNRLAVVSTIVVVLFILAVAFAPLITDYLPETPNLRNRTAPPSREHYFGTDKLGRDVFSRVLYGGRGSILIGVVSALGGAAIGVILGSVAGFLGGKIDAILVRLSELFLTFPSMILNLILVSLIGRGIFNLIFVFTITGWMTPFRLIRGKFLTLREETYASVCRAFGVSEITIMFKHILPNAISPIIVAVTINTANYILSEAGMSFIGLGVPSAVPSWGNILNAAKSLEVVNNYWWLWFFPGLVISLFVLAVNFVGDGLRDVYDPKG